MEDYAGVPGRPKMPNRTNVMQLKLIGQTHPTGLTPNLLKLFEARPPLDYKPPPEKRKCLPYTGMAQFVGLFAEKDDPEYQPPIEKSETPAQRKDRIHKLRLEEGARKATEEFEKYDPQNDPNISGDPYKTLFVAKLNYDTTERNLKREFEAYGSIKRVRLVADKVTNKPRGYAFIEYVHTRDMKAAYKQADGTKIDNRRVLVDVERGRTVPNWKPRRLGGGLGTTRIGGEDVNQKQLGRGQLQSGGQPRSEEPPRARDDRHADREKSREKGRDREGDREKSRERSYEKPKDRDHRGEDKNHRDRDRTRDRERERGRDRDDRHRDRGRDSERDKRNYEVENPNGDRGRRSRDREDDESDGHHYNKKRSYDLGEPEDEEEGLYERHRRRRHHTRHHEEEDYEKSDNHNDERGGARYEQIDEDKYQNGGSYGRRSERPTSQQYDD